MNDKKGQMIIVLIMVGIIVLIASVVMIPPLKTNIENNMNATANLNCSATGLSATTNATCVVLDMGLFYFIAIVIACGLAYLSGSKSIISIIVTIFVFIVVTILITPLKDWIILARSSGYLNCSAAGISVASKMLCIFIDIWLFYFIIAAISAAAAYAFTVKVLPQIQGGNNEQ